MKFTYRPKGVCSQLMQFDIENGIIRDVQVLGGCSGNLGGIMALIKGMSVEEVIDRLDGIHCGPRPTSCPDQLAQGLKQALQQAQGTM